MRPFRGLTSAALVLAAAGACAYAYIVDGATVSDADRIERRRDLFPAFRVDDVTRIELDHGDQRLVLERDPGDRTSWLMTSPFREGADASAVDVLLREFELAQRIRELRASDDAVAGAARVRGSIVVAKIHYDFELDGDAARPQGAAYARIAGEGTFVVGRTLKVQLLRTADAYRNRTLIPYGASEIATLNASTHEGGYTLRRRGATFRIQQAGGVRASRDAVERIFGALADARADAFVEREDAGAGDAAGLSVAVTPSDSERPSIRLTFGAPCPGLPGDVIVVREGGSTVEACIPRTVENRLTSTPDALVDQALVFAHADEIEQLRLESLAAGGGRVDLARRGTGWRERAPEDRDLTADESDSADALVGDLVRARALDVRPAKADERRTPRFRATFVRTGAGTSEVIDIGPTGSDTTAWALRLDDESVLRLTRDVSRRFEPHPIVTRGRALSYGPFDAAEVTAIDDSCGPTPQRLGLGAGRWTMTIPPGFSADAQTATDIADAVAHAKADAWITESDDGTFGLQSPSACTVALTLAAREAAGGARRVGIVFGSEHSGGFYAKTLDSQAVFLAPSALRELASHPAIDRAKLRLDAETLGRVIVLRDGERRVVDVGAEASASPGEPSDSGGGRDLGRTLAELYARDAIHAGGPRPGEGFDRPTLQIDATARADAGWAEKVITIGALTRVGPFDAYFARLAGVDATFAVPRPSVDRILSAW